jgi:hypothetical protein
MTSLAADLEKLRLSGGHEAFPDGATDDEIRGAELELGFAIDDDYKTLLRFSNGPCIGGDGSTAVFSVVTYGANKLVENIDERWRDRKWLPVTTDGCGNTFVLVTLDGVPGRPVGFIEGISIGPEPECLVASSLRTFLKFWVGDRGKRIEGWPFARQVFERFDPEFLATTPERLQPWNA